MSSSTSHCAQASQTSQAADASSSEIFSGGFPTDNPPLQNGPDTFRVKRESGLEYHMRQEVTSGGWMEESVWPPDNRPEGSEGMDKATTIKPEKRKQ